jgi:hypothetical protein
MLISVTARLGILFLVRLKTLKVAHPIYSKFTGPAASKPMVAEKHELALMAPNVPHLGYATLLLPTPHALNSLV